MRAIFTISIRGIRTHLGRLALTLVAITLGVGFVSGSLIIADSMTEVFDSIVARSSADIDGQVQPVTDLEFGEVDQPLLDTMVAQLQALPEVGQAVGFVGGEESIVLGVDADGVTQQPNGPPVLSFSWDGESSEDGFTIVEGIGPVGASEVAIDTLQAEALGASVGDVVSFSTPTGLQDLTIASIVSFEGSAGAWFSLFDLPTAQVLFDSAGTLDSITLQAATGSTPEAMLTAVESLLPAGIESINQAQVIEDNSAGFDQAIGIFSNVLLGFAAVALFVSLFIIKNTFAILVGQRTQEIGMLRAIGAGSNHIRLSIFIEAVILGLIGAAAGLLAGVGISKVLQLLLSSGGGFPDVGTVIAPRTIIVALIVGLAATVISALLPAFKAGSISPIAAMNGATTDESTSRLRTVAGAVVTTFGLVLLGMGLFGSGLSTSTLLTLLGIGAVLTFSGVAMLSVVLAGPTVRILGAPVAKAAGTSGRMAAQNAARSPQRTAATATALMVGLALVTTVMVMGQSLKTSFSNTLDTSVTADVFVYDEAETGVPAELAARIASNESVESFSMLNSDEIMIADDITNIGGLDTSTGSRIIDFDVVEGSMEALSDGGVLLFQDKADELGLGTGDTVAVTFVNGVSDTLTIEGIYADQSVMGGINWLTDISVLDNANPNLDGAWIGLEVVEGAETAAVAAEISELADGFSGIVAQDQATFQDELNAQIDSILLVVNVLLGLALVVAFFGIINTIVLSVLERTREIGLLRAVGMTRRQLRAVIRWEGVIVSIYGAILGIGLGVLFAWAAVTAVPDSFISTVTIPWVSLISMIIGAGLLGVIAAVLPARRAAKMDVLSAIATS